ncbi:unnamed protein product [Clonostachys rosea f. rosea IK726]|uniref:Uncharacterized protein n=1 Tax=Clonostachys rosea f. rosea IK726 TaxID=1349383 RepID=A0ACA9TZ23_BIOOC|nr:unnamed protein product [Clonostachys rosea f. rosea IK726]
MKFELGLSFLIVPFILAAPSSDHSRRAFTLETLTGPNGPQMYFKFTAIGGSIFANKPNNDARCEKGAKQDYATFTLKGDELFLYSKGRRRQQIYGTNDECALGYISEGEEAPEGSTLKGWAVDRTTNEVRLNGKRFRGWANVTTGTPDDIYQMYISEIDDLPEGYTAWGGIVYSEENPIGCVYS